MGDFLVALLAKVGLVLAEMIVTKVAYEVYTAWTRSREANAAAAFA